MPEVRIEGLKELSSALKKVSGDLPKELKKVSLEAAKIVADDGKTKAPVLSGKLRGSLKAAATQKGGEVRSNLIYAGPIHFGWRGHNIAPNPFLYDALDARRDEVMQKFEDGLGELMDRNFRG